MGQFSHLCKWAETGESGNGAVQSNCTNGLKLERLEMGRCRQLCKSAEIGESEEWGSLDICATGLVAVDNLERAEMGQLESSVRMAMLAMLYR
jgi:hypothetical protein